MNQHNAPSGIEYIWTVDEVSKYLQMSKSWVYKQVELGLLPCMRFGAAVRFSSYVVKLFVKEHMHGPKLK